MTEADSTTGGPPSRRPEFGHARWVLVLFMIAAVLRVGWVTARYATGSSDVLQYPDEEAYVQVAASIAAGRGLVDEFGFRATYMPGYPLFLAIFTDLGRPILWARIVQAILSAAIAPAAYLLGIAFSRLASHSPPMRTAVAVFTGLAAAFDPFLLFFSGLLLTEALTAVVLTLAWAFVLLMCGGGALRWRYAWGAGLLLLLGIMLRPSTVVLVPVSVAGLLAANRFRQRSLLATGLLVLIVIVGLAPWAERNRAVLGERVWLTTRGGISLYDGLRPGATGASDLAHTKTMPQIQGLSELEWNAYFRDQAAIAAGAEPDRVLRLAGRKFLRTWSLFPNVESYRGGIAGWGGAVWTSAVLLLAAWGSWSVRRRIVAWGVLLLPTITVTLLHTIYVGSVRYRIPVMPMLEVLAAAGAVLLIVQLMRRGRRSKGLA